MIHFARVLYAACVNLRALWTRLDGAARLDRV